MILYKQLCQHFKVSTKFIHMRYKILNSSSILFKLDKCSSKFIFPYQFIHRKYCYHFYKGDDTDSDNEEIEHKRDIKNIILPNNDDLLSTKISECKSLQDIFNILQNNNNLLNWKNISMAIAMVRELQIIYYRVYMYEKSLDCSNNISENTFESIITNDDFLNLLNLIENHYMFMNLQCLSYCVLCLHKIGIDVNSSLHQALTQRLKLLLINSPVEEIQSCILSRFIVSIISHRNLSGIYAIKDIWPIILKRLGKFL